MRTRSELGIAYDDIRALKPDIIYVTLPAFGSDGPYRSYRTWGHNLSAAAGVDHLIGWPDRDPVQIGFAYPDYVSAQAAVVAVLGALMRRNATGQGARIEVWQYAMTLSCLGPASLPPRSRAKRPGARQPRRRRAPHGLYPARGTERWIAVTVDGEATWNALCGVPGLEALADDPRFRIPRGAVEHHDALDAR